MLLENYLSDITENKDMLNENLATDILEKIGSNVTAQRIAEFIVKYLPSDLQGKVAMRALDNASSAEHDLINKAKSTGTYSNDIYDQLSRGTQAVEKGLQRTVGEVNVAGIGAVVLATLLLYGGYKTYKRFLSPAAKQCNHLSGESKTECMKKARIKALEYQIKDLKAALNSAACNHSNDPVKCKSKLREKIAKLEKQLRG